MVSLINVDPKLWKTTEFFEPLIVLQCALIPYVISLKIITCAIDSGKQRGAVKKSLSRRHLFATFLHDNFLRIGDNDIKIRVINCLEDSSFLL